MPNARARALRDELRVRKLFGAMGRRRRIPRQRPPKNTERAYTKALLGITDKVEVALQPLLDALPGLVASAAADRPRFDAGEGRRVSALLEQAGTALATTLNTTSLERLAAQFAAQTATHQRLQMSRQVRAGLGADVFIGDTGLAAAAEAFTAENVALIKSMPPKTFAEIEGIVTRGVQSGRLHKDIASDIEARFMTGRNRARLIARDQVGKYYGKVNEVRQRTMGITHFIWRTAGDERVRDEHAPRNGVTYSWANAPEGGPGQPINCRCYPEPVLDPLLP